MAWVISSENSEYSVSQLVGFLGRQKTCLPAGTSDIYRSGYSDLLILRISDTPSFLSFLKHFHTSHFTTVQPRFSDRNFQVLRFFSPIAAVMSCVVL